MRLALFGVLVVLACSSFAELDERIKVVIEEPAVGESYSGVTNLRGWVVSPAGIGRYALEVYIDGEFAFYMPVGGDRADVAETYPNYPSSDQSGFSMAFNYKSLSPGTHEIKVRAFDNVDNYNDAWVSFDAERFKSEFIADDSEIDLSTTENVYPVDNHTYSVSGVTVEGQKWDFLLSWDRASQSFKTENIRTSSAQGEVDSCDPEFDFGCSADGAYGDGDSSSGDSSNSGSGGGYEPPTADSSDGAGNADDCANVTGDNPNCSDSSGSSSGTAGGTDDSSGGGYQRPTNLACMTSPNYDRSNASVIEMHNGLQAVNSGEYWGADRWLHVIFRSQAGDWYMIRNGSELISLEVIREQDTCDPYPTGWVTGVSSDLQGNLVLEFEGNGLTATVDSSCPIGVGSGLVSYETPGASDVAGYSPSTRSKWWVVDIATVDVCEVKFWNSL